MSFEIVFVTDWQISLFLPGTEWEKSQFSPRARLENFVILFPTINGRISKYFHATDWQISRNFSVSHWLISRGFPANDRQHPNCFPATKWGILRFFSQPTDELHDFFYLDQSINFTIFSAIDRRISQFSYRDRLTNFAIVLSRQNDEFHDFSSMPDWYILRYCFQRRKKWRTERARQKRQ